MKKIVAVLGLILCVHTLFAQVDTLKYSITSVFETGKPRTDRIELSNGIIINAYYKDGSHYYWTKKLSPDEKEKELYEFEYSDPYNFNSTLTIKMYFASYERVSYSGFNTTVVTNMSSPEYKINKIIKIFDDKAVVYKYSGDRLWWTYYYDKDGILQYGINGDSKWLYSVGDTVVNVTSPTGENDRYIIGKDGYARREKGDVFSSWTDVEVGKLVPRLIIPKLKK